MVNQTSRAIDVGDGTPVKPGPSGYNPCSDAVRAAVNQLTKQKQGQLKPPIMKALGVLVGHVDHLHREVVRLTGANSQMARMLLKHEDKTRELPRLCPDCLLPMRGLLDGCFAPCTANDDGEDQPECDWLKKRRAENVEPGQDQAEA